MNCSDPKITGKSIILILTFGLMPFFLLAQDPVYSQFYHNPLGINPAFAGNTSGPLFHINYRNQWPGFDNAYSTYSMSYSQYFSPINSGLGIQILHDQAGDGILQTTNIKMAYSYRLKIRDGYFIKGGIEAGYGRVFLDWNRFTFGDAIDPRIGPISPGGTPFPTDEVAPEQNNRNYFDVGAGFLIYNKDYYVGVSLQHMNTANLTFLKKSEELGATGIVPMRFNFSGGYQYLYKKGNKKKEDSFLSPNVLYTRQAGFSQLTGGVNINYDKFITGLWYRHAGNNADAVIALVGFKKDYFKFCYSFDYTVSDLSIRSGGSHEAGIVINLEQFFPEKQNYNDCLSIFR
ncbi:MAG: type IX secretion system membrane protein PorP/SprF [Saprospiraceae bacterium]|nr:type IX secretion system membrane protein PorP/SprF [Saprospiraceae bacterium]MBK8080015.1 type IX secretion system membrane protein PorP/SprF [Saprospiraceae bacterium]MBK8370852.1 type IX secretion system membrane protein PorP/SprF [Saprospiraceae bacterium]MBK8546153.1 type IX secretion system membrane protein PorP/SprF [Saprospiraceae bacterium]MBK8854181.1 type IX secretion system membrane protein PorP/SprF [Saprospiraceae bacterium]